MNETAFVDFFRHSSPYINAHRGRTFVLCLSGETLQLPHFTSIIHDIALLHSLGIRLVIVFGARPQIDACLQQADLATEYVEHLRISSARTMPSILSTLGALCLDLEARLTFSLQNSPMAGTQITAVSGNFITAKPLGVIHGTDYQHTGEVRKVNTTAIQQQLHQQSIVILPPLGFSPTGDMFNLNAESVALATAVALKADKLIFLTPHSVTDTDGRLMHELTPTQAQRLSQAQNPRLHHTLIASAQACRQGIKRTHLINSGDNGALLKELFTRDGTGTLLTEALFEHIRAAHSGDVPGILALIEPLEQQGVLIRRSRQRLEMEIHHFIITERDNTIVGCAALYPYPADNMGELACLAIHPDYRGGKRGEQLLHYLEKKAGAQQIQHLLVLTTQSAHWFVERGFHEKTLAEVPILRAALYNFQRNSKILIKSLCTHIKSHDE